MSKIQTEHYNQVQKNCDLVQQTAKERSKSFSNIDANNDGNNEYYAGYSADGLLTFEDFDMDDNRIVENSRYYNEEGVLQKSIFTNNKTGQTTKVEKYDSDGILTILNQYYYYYSNGNLKKEREVYGASNKALGFETTKIYNRDGELVSTSRLNLDANIFQKIGYNFSNFIQSLFN